MRYIFLDCGSHLGESVKAFYETTEYTQRPSDWEIFCFEAHPDLDHLVLLEEPFRVNFIPKAVWTKDGTIPFYLGKKENCDGSSLMEEKKTGDLDKENPIIVHCLDLSNWIMTNFEPDDYIILKMDIEGAEYPVLRKMLSDGSFGWINRLYLELHAEKIQMDLQEEADLIQSIKDAYPNLELITEGELQTRFAKNIRKAVPGFWFLGESRIVSAKNSQALALLEKRVDKLEELMKRTMEKVDSSEEKRKSDKKRLAESRSYEKNKIMDKVEALKSQINFSIAKRELTRHIPPAPTNEDDL